jgi:hypothetical protein
MENTMTTDLTAITLAKGGHDGDCENPERCLFEWYNWLTRQQHTDSCPPGVSPVLHVYGMRLNDCLPDDRRQELKRFLPNGADRLAGTAGDGKDETRSLIALDWLIRIFLPAWLDLARLDDAAAAVRALSRIDGMDAAQLAGPVVHAAGAAAWDAAGAAARAAAWDAAGAAARAAAGAAAGAAARDAAGAAARDAAGDAARAAARAAARDAARAAARAAARDAARAVLAPVVTELQESAIALYDVLIAGEWPADG